MIRYSVDVMGSETVYFERNPHGARTIVMLHGFSGNHKGLTDLAQHFPGYRLILPDLPGYGESEALSGEHSIENYARWLDAFVGVLGLTDWVSWSHSYSGSIALNQACDGLTPPEAMVSVSPAAVRGGSPGLVSTFYYQMGRWIASRTRKTPLDAYASSVRMPVLIIAGSKDAIVPLRRLEYLVSLMSDGHLQVLADQGHLAPMERPTTVAGLTKRFLSRL